MIHSRFYSIHCNVACPEKQYATLLFSIASQSYGLLIAIHSSNSHRYSGGIRNFYYNLGYENHENLVAVGACV